MNKKLPSVFSPKKQTKGNNEKVFYSQKATINPPKKVKNINQKINAIFSSPNYIYKADVEITLKDETITKRIVGKNNNSLITIDNELIPISTILDIKQK